MKKLTLATFVFIAGFLFAQPGQYDFSFPYFNPFNEQNQYRFTYSMEKQSDGKIIVIDQNYTLSPNELFVYRVDQDGILDQSFSVNTISTTNLIDFPKISQFSDGKLLISGQFHNFNNDPNLNVMVRLNTDGTVDNTFIIQDTVDYSISSGSIKTCIQSDNKILVYNEENNVFNRYNYDGTVDPTFQPSGLGYAPIYNFIQLPNDKIVVWFEPNSSPISGNLVCLNSDGSIDPTFNNSHYYSNGTTPMMIKYFNNNIYLSSNYLSIDGTTQTVIACVNMDGTLNSSFNSNMSNFIPDLDVLCFDFQPNGDILIGGLFAHVNGIICNKIQRIKSNGTIDNSFTSFGGPSGGGGQVNAIICLSDNKSLVGGFFVEYNGFPSNGVQRIGNYNSNVQIYTTMDNGTCNGDTYISQQVQNPVNYIMVGEDTLQNINSNYANFNDHCAGIYTLNTQNPITGTTINTTPFVISNSQNFYGVQVPTSGISIVDTLTFCIENCLIDYATVSQVTIESYTLIGTDSLLIEFAVVDATDTTIVPLYTSVYNYGYNLIQLQLYCLQKSLGAYLVADNVIQFDGSTIQVLALDQLNQDNDIQIYPNPASSEITILFEGNQADIKITDLSGKTVREGLIQSGELVSIHSLTPGNYFIEINSSTLHVTRKIVKM